MRQDLTEEAWLPRLQGIDLVINAVGIIREQGDQRFDSLHRDAPIALFRAAQRAGVKKIIQIGIVLLMVFKRIPGLEGLL